MARGSLARFITATAIAVLIVAGLVLSFKFELGRSLLIFAGGLCVLDALARSLERYGRLMFVSDLATWAVAGLLSVVVGIAWDHVAYASREVVTVGICVLLLLGYRTIALTAGKKTSDSGDSY